MLFGLSVSFMMKITAYNYNGMNKERKKTHSFESGFLYESLERFTQSL